MPATPDVRYFVLADRAVPYFLARVRWPDVAQAISAASPDWLDDVGLFDLPYDPSAVDVSFEQAISVAAEWGTQLHPEPIEGAPSYIRRMPAGWSNPSPSERNAFGIEFAGRLRAPARRIRQPSTPPDLGSSAVERRQDVRVRVGGHAHLRHDGTTLSVGVVDLSRTGARCVLSRESRLIAPGTSFGQPVLLEVESDGSHVCLDVTSRVGWSHSTNGGTQFGIAFAELTKGENDGMQRLLAAASRR